MTDRGVAGELIALAGLNGALGVGFGAWAAHGAERVLEPALIGWIDTASRCQLVHAVAILAVAALPSLGRSGWWIALCFAVGALLFSCSLYLMAFGGWRWLGPVTPLGGLLLLAGWFWLILAGLRLRKGDRA